MPKASFPSPPSPENAGSFLLREPQPRRCPSAPAQQPPEGGFSGTLPKLKAVTQFFQVHLPHQDRGPGLRAVSAQLPSESPVPSMGPGPCLTLASVCQMNEGCSCEQGTSALCAGKGTGSIPLSPAPRRFLFPSSCTKSGPAMASSISTSPSTWSGEREQRGCRGSGYERQIPSWMPVG